jgi:hypothetical protein
VVPASLAFGLCVLVVGAIVFVAARANRLDPSLRTAAVVTLAVLGGGVFLFVWLTHYSMLAYALLDARRQSTVLHADARRLLVETTSPSGDKSVAIPVESIDSDRILSDLVPDGEAVSMSSRRASAWTMVDCRRASRSAYASIE